MNKGFWNGEPTATFVGVTYEVTEPEKPTWWSKQFVGQRRQGIQITYEGHTWIIDNEHGDGYYKVTKGEGSPWCSHKSVSNPINVIEITDDQINKMVDGEGLAKESKAQDDYLEKNFPVEFQHMKGLRAMISKANVERQLKLKK